MGRGLIFQESYFDPKGGRLLEKGLLLGIGRKFLFFYLSPSLPPND